MEIVTFVNFLSLFIVCAGSLFSKVPKKVFLLTTIFLICFYSIRTDYGNDLPGYVNTFERISNFDFSYVSDGNERMEPGWVALNILFAPLGWQCFLTFITAIQFFAYYKLIIRYVKPSLYGLIFAFIILNSNLLLTQLSMLRQAFAMSICVFAVPYILDRKYLVSGLIILLATTFHTSAYIMFSMLLVPAISRIKPHFIIIGLISIFICFKIFSGLADNYLSFALKLSTFEKYEVYLEEKENDGFGLGILLLLITSCWLLYKYGHTSENRFFIITTSIPVILTPFCHVIPLISRLGFYFALIGTVAYQIKDKRDIIGWSLITLLLIIYLSGYFSFFESPVWHDAFKDYHTIFD